MSSSIGLHEPQPVPAPHVFPISATVSAPPSIAARTALSDTTLQRQTITEFEN
jgi:hypothetical protein